MVEVHVLAVSDDWDNETSRGGDSGADVNEISVDHLTVVNHSVDDWLLLESVHRGLYESTSETELDSVFLGECFLNLFASIHELAHVDFIESGQESVLVLRLFESLGDRLTHPGHLDSCLSPCSSNLRWSLLRSGGLG